MKKKFLIFTPSYNEISGGIVVLHKLCSILNDLGYESYLHPYVYSYELHRNNIKEFLVNLMKWSVLTSFQKYKCNKAFNTPVYKGKFKECDDWIVIYPEVVFGNPLNAKNIVRWLLHQPGFHEGVVYYGANELYFKFNSAIKDFHFQNSATSKTPLKVIHYPIEHYNTQNIADVRKGTAYCLRKGKGKQIGHDLKDSILIDGKSHAEVARILKTVKTFISYDTYTAYSIFAVLCGCESIVVPDEGVTEEQWYPNEKDRYGISYGFNRLEWARSTSHLVLKHVEGEELKNITNVRLFINDCHEFFLP